MNRKKWKEINILRPFSPKEFKFHYKPVLEFLNQACYSRTFKIYEPTNDFPLFLSELVVFASESALTKQSD